MIDFRVKICGVRTPEDIEACVKARADCVGLNFYPPSIRYLDPESAAVHTVNTLAATHRIVRVGLFVNEVFENILAIADRFQLNAIQLHGDETPDLAARLISAGHPIIRAVRLPTTAITPAKIQTIIGEWSDLPVTLLLDADAGAHFGGGGKQLHWPSLAAWSQKHAPTLPDPHWILAGGLHSDNVREALDLSQSHRLDVASGVESPKGKKSPELIRKFVANSRARGVDAEP